MSEGEGKARILVVEDESIVALDMRSRLESMGYEVVGLAATGDDAVALAEKNLPDLILMDIKLKGDLDGVQAAEIIRRSHDVPVIFITAFADGRTLARAKVTQAFGYILKPFQEREVLISIEMALFKHRMEKELRGSKELLNATLDAITDAVIALDEDEHVVFLNRSAEKLLGTDDGRARGLSLHEICTFQESPILSGLLSSRRTESSSNDVSWVILETGAGKRPVELIRTSILGHTEGVGIGQVLSIRDISEIVTAEETRVRLAAIVSNSYDAILAVNSDLVIVSWNFGAELMYGYTAEQMVGKNLWTLVPDEKDRTHLRSLADLVLAGQEVGRFETLRRCRSGKIVTVSLSLSPVRDAEGRVVELACIERDISAEKEYEASLIKAKLVAEEASRAKDEFLSNMSHELRTPLNSIIGMIELSRDLAMGHEQREYLEIARQSANNLLFLINSILDFSKIEAGKMTINAVPFDLVSAAADCVESLSVQAYRKGIDLFFRFDSAVPSRMIGDPHRFQQILANILSNAIKFTERGYVRVDIDVSSSSDDENAIIDVAVRDTGIGIPQEKLKSIWDEFTQLDGSSTRAYGGTGLGLAIVKSLTDLMGGSICVESELERGSVFTISLPFVVASGTVEPEASVRGSMIAVVSSSSMEQEILKELLSSWGCAPALFDDAASFIEFLKETPSSPPRLTLIDARLPDKERLFALSQDDKWPDLLRHRLVILSSIGARKEHRWLSLSESTYFLIKPVRRDVLLALIQAGNTGSLAIDPQDQPVSSGVSHRGVNLELDDFSHSIGLENRESSESESPESELIFTPDVQNVLECFFQEIEVLGSRPSPGLEISATRYHKELDDLHAKELSRKMFKIMLACRRDDADAVNRELESIRSALHADQDATR